jgi:hypothetical protein
MNEHPRKKAHARRQLANARYSDKIAIASGVSPARWNSPGAAR